MLLEALWSSTQIICCRTENSFLSSSSDGPLIYAFHSSLDLRQSLYSFMYSIDVLMSNFSPGPRTYCGRCRSPRLGPDFTRRLLRFSGPSWTAIGGCSYQRPSTLIFLPRSHLGSFNQSPSCLPQIDCHVGFWLILICGAAAGATPVVRLIPCPLCGDEVVRSISHKGQQPGSRFFNPLPCKSLPSSNMYFSIFRIQILFPCPFFS